MTELIPTGGEHVRSQAERGCAFWQREPGSDDDRVNSRLVSLPPCLDEDTLKDKTVYLLLDNPTGEPYSPLGNLEGNRLTGIRVKSTTPKATEVPGATEALNNRLIAIAERLGVPVINTLD